MKRTTLGLITLLVIGCGNAPKYQMIGTTSTEGRKVFIYQEVGRKEYAWSYSNEGVDLVPAWMGGDKVYLESPRVQKAYPMTWVREVK